MRRKFQSKKPDPNAVPVPGSGASIPERPKDLMKAQGLLQEHLLGREAHVAQGYGFGDVFSDDPKDRDSSWRLYVFTDLDAKQLPLPAEVMGFPVARRRSVSPSGPRPASSRKW